MHHSAASRTLPSESEMQRLIQHCDWSASPLGSRQYWSRALLANLEFLLQASSPMMLFWGETFTCFYNDAWLPFFASTGRHPFALGKSAAELWSESWPELAGLFYAVKETNKARVVESRHFLSHLNKSTENSYGSYGFNPVKNENGEVDGVLVIGYEADEKEKPEAAWPMNLAVEACDLGTFVLDPGTRLFSCNEKTKTIFGLSATDHVSLDLAVSLIHPRDRKRVEQAIGAALDPHSGGRYAIPYTIIHPQSGKEVMVKATGRVFFDLVGKPTQFAGTLQDVTAEKLVERHNRKLQQLVENSNDFVGMAAMDGQMTYTNAAGRKMVGLPADLDITTTTNRVYYSEEQFSFITSVVVPALAENRKWSGVVKVRHFVTGEEIPCHASYLLISDPETDEIISRGVTFRDLRPELEATKGLEDSEKRFRNPVQEAPVATAIYTGPEMRIQWANDAMIKLWGKDKSVVGKTVRQALPELEGQPFHQQLDTVFRTGMLYQATEDAAHLVVDGKLQTYYFNFSYKPLRDAKGEIYGILNMAVDVTEGVNIRRKLEESEKAFRQLIMQAPMGIVLLVGDEHRVDLVNDEYLELVGRDREEMTGKPIWEAIPEAKAQGFDILLQNVKDTGEAFFGNEIPVVLKRKKTLETVYVNFVYEPLFDTDGQVNSILVVAFNVTRQVEARKQAEGAEERARIAMDSAQLGAYELNIVTGTLHSSPRMFDLFDIEPTEKQSDFLVNIHPDDLPARQKAHKVALETGKLEYECRVKRRDGTQNWVHIFGRYYFDGNGQPEKAIGIVKDITREKTGEQDLERRVRERTEELTKLNKELQQLTYVSSHDLKEPLRKIHLFTGLVKEAVPADQPKLHEYADKVLASVNRMKSLIDDLLNYSLLSNTGEAFEAVDLALLIDHIQDDLELLIEEKNATIVAEKLPVVSGIPFQLNQLFYNLLQNALKFSKDGQPQNIRIDVSEIDADEETLPPELTEKAYYKIEVKDSGIGFQPENAEKIFNVFQRLHLKHQYAGNGIGLAICKKIVQNHKGSINATAAAGEGASFIVLLPKTGTPGL